MQRLITLLGAITGYAFVACHRRNSTVDLVSRGFPIKVQEHLLGVHPFPVTMIQHLEEFGELIWRPRGLLDAERGCVYAILAPADGYWGHTHDLRERDSGIYGRPFDHLLMLAKLRSRAKGARPLAKKDKLCKYLVFKDTPLDEIYIIPFHFSSLQTSSGFEAYAIRAAPLSANRQGRRARPAPRVRSNHGGIGDATDPRGPQSDHAG